MRGCVGLVAVLFALQSLGTIKFAVPEVPLQTVQSWPKQFGTVTAAAMWGCHLGLGLITRVRYGGFWVVVLATIIEQNIVCGIVLLNVYWLGRAASVWLGVILLREEIMTDWGQVPELGRLHAIGLAWAAWVMIAPVVSR